MKKIFALLALSAFVFVACSDDDEYIPQGPVTTFAGKLPTQVGEYSFKYDSQNRCVQIKEYDNIYYVIDYDKGTITLDGEQADVTFNKQGYIVGLSMVWDGKYGDDQYKGSGTIKYSYNKAGQLESSVTSSQESGKEDGIKYESKYTATSTYKWKDGNLVKSTTESVDIIDGEKETMKDIYSFRYGEEVNVVEQNTYFQSEMIEECDVLVLLGLFGKPSVNFPVECENTWSEKNGNTEYESSDNYYFSYSFNADNTIRTETFDGRTIKYTYIQADDLASKSVCQPDEIAKPKPSLRSLFVKKHLKK